MINVDGSVFIQIANFIFLIWVMNMILYKPIRKALLQRKDKISGLELSIADFNAQAVEKENAFASGIKEARANGLREKQALIQSGSDEEKIVIENINKKAQAELAKSREKIAKDAESVRITLQKELDTFVNAIGQKILGEGCLMKIAVMKKKRRRGLLLAMSVLVLLWVGMAFASSGADTHGADTHGSADKHGEAAHEGDAHKAKGWVATDTYRVLNFAVLAGALFFLLRKPISQALDSRIKGIQAQLEDLESKKAEAEKILSGYNAKIARLSQESEGIVAEYIRQGNEAKARILKEAELSAVKLEEQARRNIENEFELAKQRLQQDIFTIAMTKAEEIIKKNITADDQNRLVDEYLDKVVA